MLFNRSLASRQAAPLRKCTVVAVPKARKILLRWAAVKYIFPFQIHPPNSQQLHDIKSSSEVAAAFETHTHAARIHLGVVDAAPVKNIVDSNIDIDPTLSDVLCRDSVVRNIFDTKCIFVVVHPSMSWVAVSVVIFVHTFPFVVPKRECGQPSSVVVGFARTPCW